MLDITNPLLKSALTLSILGTYQFFCVCVGEGGGGEVNFEGNRKKADLIKGGIKFGRNIARGKEITNLYRRNTFFDNLNV